MSATRYLLNSIFVIAMLAAGATLANADPATYDYTGPHFAECAFGPCPANYTSDYLIASFTLPAPLGPDVDAVNELPFVTKWSISDKLGYLALSSSDPQGATELGLLTFDTFGALGGEFTASSQGLPGGASESGSSFGFAGDGILISPTLANGGGANAWDAQTAAFAVGAWVDASAVPEPRMVWLLAAVLSVISFAARVCQGQSPNAGANK